MAGGPRTGLGPLGREEAGTGGPRAGAGGRPRGSVTMGLNRLATPGVDGLGGPSRRAGGTSPSMPCSGDICRHPHTNQQPQQQGGEVTERRRETGQTAHTLALLWPILAMFCQYLFMAQICRLLSPLWPILVTCFLVYGRYWSRIIIFDCSSWPRIIKFLNAGIDLLSSFFTSKIDILMAEAGHVLFVLMSEAAHASAV